MNDGDYRITSLVDASTVGDEHAWHEIVDRHIPRLANLIRRFQVEYGNGAYTGRIVDQDLPPASLSFDSSLERVQELRSDPDDARVLVFTAPPLSLELEVMPDRVVGQIVPPGPAEIWVEATDGATFRVEADDVGFFDLHGMPRGRVRLRCDTPTGRLVTEWVCL